jgi:hypothetical protein
VLLKALSQFFFPPKSHRTVSFAMTKLNLHLIGQTKGVGPQLTALALPL